MKEYLVPTGDGEAQFIERRSRFIGHIFLTETEEEALARLKQMREQYWDATHNVYAYIIRDGATRFSDDGEPGGTAGMPVLQVLQREELYNVTCVVTRYFGGILLGADWFAPMPTVPRSPWTPQGAPSSASGRMSICRAPTTGMSASGSRSPHSAA